MGDSNRDNLNDYLTGRPIEIDAEPGDAVLPDHYIVDWVFGGNPTVRDPLDGNLEPFAVPTSSGPDWGDQLELPLQLERLQQLDESYPGNTGALRTPAGRLLNDLFDRATGPAASLTLDVLDGQLTVGEVAEIVGGVAGGLLGSGAASVAGGLAGGYAANVIVEAFGVEDVILWENRPGAIFDRDLAALREHFGNMYGIGWAGAESAANLVLREIGFQGIEFVNAIGTTYDAALAARVSDEAAEFAGILAGVAYLGREIALPADYYQDFFEITLVNEEYGDLTDGILRDIGSVQIKHQWDFVSSDFSHYGDDGYYTEEITYIGRDDNRYSNDPNEPSSGFEPGHYIDRDNGWEISIQDPDDANWSPPELHTFSTPIVIDLNGDGLVKFTSIEKSNVHFDIDDDGFLEKTAWVSVDEHSGVVEDGFLVADRNGDGKVQGSELALANITADPGDTDLEALAALYDTNLDGVVDSSDSGFSELRIWKDLNADGVTDAGELMTLGEVGLTSINVDTGADGAWTDVSDLSDSQLAVMGLTPEDVAHSSVPGVVGQEAVRFDGSIALFSLTTVTINDEQRLTFDLGFGHQVEGKRQSTTTAGNKQTEWEDGRLTLEIADPSGSVIDVSASGYDAVFGGDGDDAISAGYTDDSYGSVVIMGGAGSDSLTGADGIDYLTGDDGADTISAGAGDDVIFFDALDIVSGEIDGGEGTDTAYALGWQAGDPGIAITLSDHNLEIVSGSSGDDTLNAGTAPVDGEGQPIGVSILGMEGNDSLVGDVGDDDLIGGDGYDTLIAGAGDDMLDGGAGSDQLDAGDGEDTLALGAGDDTLSGGANGDVFVYRPGNGDDILADFQVGLDRLELASVAEEDVTIAADGADTVLTIQLVDGVDTVRLQGVAQNSLQFGDILFGFVNGTDNSDASLNGNRMANVIAGRDGNDVVAAGAGDDLVLSGTGDDTVDGGVGDDRVIGAEGDDSLFGGDGDDELDGGAGDDTLFGNAGEDFLGGGSGRDFIDGGENPDALFGASGNDTLLGNTGDDVIDAGTGNDSVEGGAGEDVVVGGEGSDTIRGDAEDDLLSGGKGDDSIAGGDGDDELIGGLGNDTSSGGSGADVFRFETGDGDDVITDFEPGVDRIELWHVSSDSVTVTADGADVVVDTGDGTLRVLNAGVAEVTAALDFVHQTGTAGGDALTGHGGVNMLIGGAGADTLAGHAGADALSGGAGADSLDGGDGDDRLEGGADADTLTGGAGEDGFVFEAGGGDDRVTDFVPGEDLLVFRGLSRSDLTIEADPADSANTRILFTGGSVILVGVAASAIAESDLGFIDTGYDNWSNTIVGSLEGDALSGGYGNDGLFGDAGDDTLDGGDGNDLLQGELGDDSLDGGDGADALSGGRGADSLDGGEGADVLEGGRGSDTLTGGEGADLYVFSEGDGQGNVGTFTVDDPRFEIASGHLKLKSDQTLSEDAGATVTVTVSAPDGSQQVFTIDVPAADSGSPVNSGAAIETEVTLTGTEGRDTLAGSVHRSEELIGLGERDYLYGDGPSGLYGTLVASNDVLDGGEGNDHITGDSDRSIHDDVVGGNDLLIGGDGNDQLYGENYWYLKDNSRGGDDTLDGGAGNDSLYGDGWALHDTSVGGNDLIKGGAGNDTIYADGRSEASGAQGGDDTLIGGAGNDQLWGNSGSDVFVIDANSGDDTIRDFEQGTDLVHIDRAGVAFDDLEITDHGSYRLVEVGSDSVAVYGLPTGAALTATDFQFAESGSNSGSEGGGSVAGLDAGAVIGALNLSASLGGDRITDFDQASDRLSLTVDDPTTVSVQVIGGDTVVTYGTRGDQVTLAGVVLPDLLSGGQIEIVSNGTDDAETLDGTVASDVIAAGEGDDTAYAGKGNDLVSGGVGNDTIYGDRDQAGNADSWQLVIKASGEHYQGAPMMEVTIDGVAYPLIEVTEVYGQDEPGTYVIEVSDNFEPSDLTIRFTNDEWGGTPETDRNLLVHEIWIDGQQVDPSAISNTPPDWEASWNDPNDGLFVRMDRDDFAVAVDLSQFQPNRDDVLLGGEGDDHLVSDYGNNLLDGESGADLLEGGSDSDTLIGGDGADTLEGNGGTDYLDGGDDADSLMGGDDSDILTGGKDADTLKGDGGDDTLLGGRGDDSLTGGAGADLFAFTGGSVSGGPARFSVDDARFEVVDGQLKLKSDQSLDYETEQTVSVTVTATDSDGVSTTETFAIAVQDIEDSGFSADDTITGTIEGDNLTGTKSVREELVGLSGDDSIFGDGIAQLVGSDHGSNDIMDGGDGNDSLFGDVLGGINGNAVGGSDLLLGGAGEDILIGDTTYYLVDNAKGGNDTLYGGLGSDGLVGDVWFFFQLDAVGGDDLLMGGDGIDMLSGDAGAALQDQTRGGNDTLDGGAGSDILYGDTPSYIEQNATGGDDLLIGGDGDDSLFGDAGDSSKLGAGGNDTLIDPPPSEWSSPMFWNEEDQRCRGNDTSLRKSSRSCGRWTCFTARGCRWRTPSAGSA